MENETLPPQQSAAFEETPNLRHYWHMILERRWLVITAFVSMFSLCLIYLFKATPIYQASVRMQIDKEIDNVLDSPTRVSFDIREQQDYLQTQYKNLMSRSLIEKVMKELKLDKDERYAKELDPVRALASDIAVSPIRLTRLVEIKAEHPDRKIAASIANKLVEIFIQQNLDLKREKMRQTLLFLEQEAGTLEKKVSSADQDLHKFRVEKKMVSLEESQNIVSQSLKQAQADVDMATSAAGEAQKLYDEVEALLKEGKPPATIPAISRDPLIVEMTKQLAERETLLAGLLTKYKDKWPAVITARKEIAENEKALKEQSGKIVSMIRNDARLAQAKLQSKQSELRIKEEKAQELRKQRIDYEMLERKSQQAKLLFNLVLQRQQETNLTANDKTQNMRIIDAAEVPTKPVKPRIVLTLFLGFAGGLAVAVGLALFVSYLDDSIKSQDDVENYLRLPFLGYVPNIKTNSLIERDLQAHSHPQSNAAEGFRTIRAAISLAHQSEKFRLFAVTSTIPSEGKSLVASNLAIVMAQTGLKTLLIDGDLRRPSVHKAFQLQSPVGLSSYLSEKVNRPEELVHQSSVPNLDVICCGAVPSSPSELIGSRRMLELLEAMGKKYDRVVVDCPPVSAVADPLIVAAMCDGVVYVSKFNKIRREHARKSVQRIQNAGIHIIGAVINDIDFEGKDSYYYSYYYYQNRYYSSHYRSKGEAGKDKPKDTQAGESVRKA
jgi:capsular exopolysaccharide synthesis family protein